MRKTLFATLAILIVTSSWVFGISNNYLPCLIPNPKMSISIGKSIEIEYNHMTSAGPVVIQTWYSSSPNSPQIILHFRIIRKYGTAQRHIAKHRVI